jgi:hypothetical protein
MKKIKKSYPESDEKPMSVRLNELKGPLMEMTQKENRSANYIIKLAVRNHLIGKGYKIKK